MSQIIRIKLTVPQQRLVTMVATDRRLFCQERNIPPKHGSDDNWEDDKNGLYAEFAVALYTGLFWDGSVGNFEEPDVGGCIEVKSMRERGYRLVLHRDSKDLPHVCSWVDPPYVELYGWVHARDGKQERYWCDPARKGAPAFFVPRPYKPMHELCAWAYLEGVNKYDRGQKAVA